MVLCNRCQTSDLETSAIHGQARPCVSRDGRPCLECEEYIELERKIPELQDRRRNLLTQMNANHDPFILKFPLEIGSHIFSLCIDERDYGPDSFALRKLPIPFLLGTVCRGWRQLARSMPQLWSMVSFSVGKPTKVDSLPRLQAVSDWLQLSGSLPLTCWVFNYHYNTVSYGPVIDALNQHSGRWRKLFLQLPPSYIYRFYGTSPPINLCDLQIITVTSCFESDSDGVAPRFRMKSKPSPTHLTVQLENFPIFALDIMWDNLTSLRAKRLAFKECMDVIRQVPLLQFCSLELGLSSITLSDAPAIPTPIVRLMYLRELELFHFPVDFLVRFIDALELPFLERYNYKTSLGNDIMADTVISLLNRSGCRLVQLSVCLLYQPAVEDFKKLFDAVPYIETLHLEFWSTTSSLFTDDLLQQLSSSPPVLAGGIPGFLPHLQSLKFSFCAVHMWGCIPRIYSWPHRKRLSLEFNLQTPSPARDLKIQVDNDTLDKILQLTEQGANIRIFEGGRDFLH